MVVAGIAHIHAYVLLVKTGKVVFARHATFLNIAVNTFISYLENILMSHGSSFPIVAGAIGLFGDPYHF